MRQTARPSPDKVKEKEKKKYFFFANRRDVKGAVTRLKNHVVRVVFIFRSTTVCWYIIGCSLIVIAAVEKNGHEGFWRHPRRHRRPLLHRPWRRSQFFLLLNARVELNDIIPHKHRNNPIWGLRKCEFLDFSAAIFVRYFRSGMRADQFHIESHLQNSFLCGNICWAANSKVAVYFGRWNLASVMNGLDNNSRNPQRPWRQYIEELPPPKRQPDFTTPQSRPRPLFQSTDAATTCVSGVSHYHSRRNKSNTRAVKTTLNVVAR